MYGYPQLNLKWTPPKSRGLSAEGGTDRCRSPRGKTCSISVAGIRVLALEFSNPSCALEIFHREMMERLKRDRDISTETRGKEGEGSRRSKPVEEGALSPAAVPEGYLPILERLLLSPPATSRTHPSQQPREVEVTRGGGMGARQGLALQGLQRHLLEERPSAAQSLSLLGFTASSFPRLPRGRITAAVVAGIGAEGKGGDTDAWMMRVSRTQAPRPLLVREVQAGAGAPRCRSPTLKHTSQRHGPSPPSLGGS